MHVAVAVLGLPALLAACASTATSHSLGPVPTTAPSRCISHNGLPDPVCTPGATDPRVTQANIHSTICVNGYTRKVRPPTSYTNPVKTAEMRAYGDTGPKSSYELDHLIPLELGGAPRSTLNLWPEPLAGGTGANSKDRVENELHRRVCSGALALGVAQQRIASNWRTALSAGP
jgi:hypothetical protein